MWFQKFWPNDRFRQNIFTCCDFLSACDFKNFLKPFFWNYPPLKIVKSYVDRNKNVISGKKSGSMWQNNFACFDLISRILWNPSTKKYWAKTDHEFTRGWKFKCDFRKKKFWPNVTMTSTMKMGSVKVLVLTRISDAKHI